MCVPRFHRNQNWSSYNPPPTPHIFLIIVTGYTTLDVFREQLVSIGLDETPEVMRILQQVPITFSALMKAYINDRTAPVPTDIRIEDFAAGGKPSKVCMCVPMRAPTYINSSNAFVCLHAGCSFHYIW